MPRAFQQLHFLRLELSADAERRHSLKRLLLSPARRSSWVTGKYRLQRFFLLLLGRFAFLGNLPLLPLYLLCEFMGGRHEIPARADIGPGLYLAHPVLPCVISAHAVVGRNLYLTGGNVIGARRVVRDGEIRIGDNCKLGTLAQVIGPVVIGHGVRIGSGAVVVKDVADGLTVVGIPACALEKACA